MLLSHQNVLLSQQRPCARSLISPAPSSQRLRCPAFRGPSVAARPFSYQHAAPAVHRLHRIAAAAEQGAAVGSVVVSSKEYSALQGVKVQTAGEGTEVELTSLWQAQPGNRVVLAFLTHFADLSSIEFAQKLEPLLPGWRAAGVTVVAVGLGEPDRARKFAQLSGFPLELLYADPMGACCSVLGFNPGFAPELGISPYAKLFPMLAGIGSPGTMQEVFRGYFGDRSSKPIFTGSNPFDILGSGYQRPFELATLRLYNMQTVLSNWAELCPREERLLTQQGGCLVFDGAALLYKHADSGILKFADVGEVNKAVGSDSPHAGETQVLRPFA